MWLLQRYAAVSPKSISVLGPDQRRNLYRCIGKIIILCWRRYLYLIAKHRKSCLFCGKPPPKYVVLIPKQQQSYIDATFLYFAQWCPSSWPLKWRLHPLLAPVRGSLTWLPKASFAGGTKGNQMLSIGNLDFIRTRFFDFISASVKSFRYTKLDYWPGISPQICSHLEARAILVTMNVNSRAQWKPGGEYYWGWTHNFG